MKATHDRSAAVERYQRDGFYFPVPVLTPDEAREYRRRLEAVEAAHGGPLSGELRHKPHLLFTWLADLVRHPAILDAVEDVLGPEPAGAGARASSSRRPRDPRSSPGTRTRPTGG